MELRAPGDRRVANRREENRPGFVCRVLSDAATVAVIIAVCAGVIIGSLVLLILPACN